MKEYTDEEKSKLRSIYTDNQLRFVYSLGRLLLALVITVALGYIHIFVFECFRDPVVGILNSMNIQIRSYPESANVGTLEHLLLYVISWTFTDILFVLFYLYALMHEYSLIKKTLRLKFEENPQLSVTHYLEVETSKNYNKSVRVIFIILEIIVYIAVAVGLCFGAYYYITRQHTYIADGMPLYLIYANVSSIVESALFVITILTSFMFSTVWIHLHSRKKRICVL